MKIIEDSIETKLKKYVSEDGIEFDYENECKEYEKTARFHINLMFNELVVKSGNAEDFLPYICNISEEYEYYIVKARNHNDLQTINMFLYMKRGSQDVNRSESYVKGSDIEKTLAIFVDDDNGWAFVARIDNAIDKLKEYLIDE